MGVLVRLLGPTALEVDGDTLDLPRQQVRVLSVLAARAPGSASRDLIVETLWGENPPASATNAVQVYVSGLRKAVAATGWPDALIVGDRGGYRLGETVEIDAQLLRRLVNAATSGVQDGAVDVAAWDDPRVAVRGTPLHELEDSGSWLDDRAELDALLLTARRLRHDELLLAGRASVVVGELAPVVASDPTDERSCGVLARAQYLMGHQVDALGTLTAHRSAMSEELGLDPSPALVTLERQILLQDPALMAREPRAVREKASPREDDRPIGREGLVSDVARAVATTPGLITLVGRGGIGKTTIARAVARLLSEGEDPRPVITVSAAAWPPESSVLDGIASEVAPRDDPDAYEHAVEAIRSSRAIVILDNLEHLQRAEGEVARFVEDLDGGVLATSRRPVGTLGERVVRVPSLGAEEGGPAVEVFLRRAARAGYDHPTPDLTQLAHEVAVHSGGVPLAIELVASWLRVLDVGAVRDRLGLALYETHERAVPERQQSLATIVEEGLSMMSVPAQELFDRFSVSLAGARMSAVEALMEVPGSTAERRPVEHLLLELVDAGLVHPVQDPDGAFRYTVLPPVHEHASVRFRDRRPDLQDAVRSAWSRDVAHMVQSIGPRVRATDGLAVRQVLRIELPHLRSAAAWLADHGEVEAALDALLKLRNFAELESRVKDLCELIEDTLRPAADVPAAVRARALNALALLYPRLDRAADARSAAEEALAIASAEMDDVLVGRLHTTLAGLLVDERRLDEAVEHLDAAEALRAAEGDVIGVAVVRNHRGLALLGERRYQEAEQAFHSVLDLPGIDEYPDAALTARYNVALALALSSDSALAAQQLTVALDDALAIDENEMVAYIAVAGAVAFREAAPATSAELAGIAMTALRRMDEELEGIEAAALDATVEGIRSELGDVTFTRAFARGAAIDAAGVAGRVRTHLEALLA